MTARKGAGRPVAPPERSRRSKYGVDTSDAGKAARTVDGRLFASKREAARYVVLRTAERAGLIRDLECQVRYDLHAPDGTAIGRYVADFRYYWTETGRPVTEDVKGAKTDLYRWKKKHTEAEHNVTIWEI